MPTFVSSEDLPVAPDDAVVEVELDHGVKVQRKIMAGTRVPADLVDAWREQTGAPLTDREKDLAKIAATAAAAATEVATSKQKAAAKGVTPDAEKGDPAPARKVSTRAPAETTDG
jgi:hypothetical protein